MLTTVCQRWRDRRGSYRPAGEVINPRHFEVAPIHDDATAKNFVLQHHYAGSYPAARFRFGLYWGGLLVGVAVFSQPTNNLTLAPFPGAPVESVELGRLVLLDLVPGNAESWFVARCFDLLRRKGLVGVVSFSDPEPRERADGEVVFAGHVGTIYQALNGIYTGRSSARRRLLLPDGSMLHERTLAKIRRRERGWEYASRVLEGFGAAALGDGDPGAWLKTWLPRLTRPQRHGGNHRYLWGLTAAAKRHLGRKQTALPYPKFVAVTKAS